MPNKKQIDLIMRSFYGGGAERALVTLANRFSTGDYRVRLIVFSSDGPCAKYLSETVEVVEPDSNMFGGCLPRLSKFLSLFRLFSRSNAEVSMSTIREVNLICIFFGFVSGRLKRHVVREPDTLGNILQLPTLSRRLKLLVNGFVYRRALRIIANSEATRDDLVKFYGVEEGRITVIYNPLDLRKIEEAVTPIGLNFSPNRIVACGRLSPKKNFGELLRALSLLLVKKSDVELILLGTGDEEDHLRTLANELGIEHAVTFAGFVDNPYSYFKASPVFVQTSLWEGFGYVLAEALAAGCSVIAYDGEGAMSEILGCGEYGDLVPVGHTSELAEKILMRLEDGAIPFAQDSSSRFDEKIIAEAYLAVLIDQYNDRYNSIY